MYAVIGEPFSDKGAVQLIKTEFITVYVEGAAGYEGIAAQIIENDSETLL